MIQFSSCSSEASLVDFSGIGPNPIQLYSADAAVPVRPNPEPAMKVQLETYLKVPIPCSCIDAGKLDRTGPQSLVLYVCWVSLPKAAIL